MLDGLRFSVPFSSEFVIGAEGYPFLHFSGNEKKAPLEKTEIVKSDNSDKGGSLVFPSPVTDESQRKPFTAADLLPRADNLPWSAPYYDELTRPSDFPRIAACIESSKSCNCYTQQATPLTVDFKTCQAIVKNGAFDNWQSQRKRDDMQSFSTSPQTSQVDAPKNEARNLASLR